MIELLSLTFNRKTRGRRALNYVVRTTKNRSTLSERHSRSPAKRRGREEKERKGGKRGKTEEKRRKRKKEGRRTRTWRDFLHPKNNSRLDVRMKK